MKKSLTALAALIASLANTGCSDSNMQLTSEEKGVMSKIAACTSARTELSFELEPSELAIKLETSPVEAIIRLGGIIDLERCALNQGIEYSALTEKQISFLNWWILNEEHLPNPFHEKEKVRLVTPEESD